MCGVVQAMDWNALMEECIVRTLPVDYIYVRPSTLLYELIHKCAVHLGCLRSIVYGSSKTSLLAVELLATSLAVLVWLDIAIGTTA